MDSFFTLYYSHILGNVYTSKDVVAFIKPFLETYDKKHPEIGLYVRGDSGFAGTEPKKILAFYYNHEIMKNFIKKYKNGFKLNRMSSQSFLLQNTLYLTNNTL